MGWKQKQNYLIFVYNQTITLKEVTISIIAIR